MLHERNDYPDLLVQVAQQSGIGAALIEKDYWVTEALRVIASEFQDGVVFKGGTSLSKAHKLIDRFSEDIDLLIVVEGAGSTAGQRDRYMKAIAARVGEIDGLELRAAPDHSSRGTSRAVTYDYAPVTEGMQGVEPTVILEMGIRGGPNPQNEMQLSSMLGTSLSASGISDEGTGGFPMPVLDPVRTLVEKLSALHSGCTRYLEGDEGAVRRISRHYTDVDALLSLDHVLKFIAGSEYEPLIAEVQAMSAENFSKDHRELNSARFSESVALSPTPELLEALRADHESTASIYFRGVPNLDAVIERISKFRDL